MATPEDHILVLEQKLAHYEPILEFFQTYAAFYGTVKNNLCLLNTNYVKSI